MDHTLTWGPPLSKTSYLKLFLFLALLSCIYGSTTGQVIEPIRDKAVLSCGYNISVNELVNMRVYWQKQTEMVLSVINGKVEVWKNYENRTFADFHGNHSLVILGLRLSDSGTYTCVIQKLDKMSYKVEHLANVKLLVKASFPVPSITDLGNSFPNIRRIYCSTSGGFPEPQLFWLENGKELNATNITVSQDPETKLYTIGSELDFNVTNNHNFICLVKYGDLKVSQTFIWEKIISDSQSSNTILYALLGLFFTMLIIFTGGCMIYRYATRRKERMRNLENVEMERLRSINTGPANHQT